MTKGNDIGDDETLSKKKHRQNTSLMLGLTSEICDESLMSSHHRMSPQLSVPPHSPMARART